MDLKKIHLLIRLARFKKQCRKLPPEHYPLWLKDAAKKQGIIIK